MMIVIRGRRIRVQARAGQRQHYVRLYSQFTDERLDELEQERIADDLHINVRSTADSSDV